ncbi:MAG TPA: methionyl-tRNA formyltransferase, partial [Phyllobacterium sp.]|nr:methionyl-tRNA formyltransferase [Phyllobacterium sp.]
VLETGIMIMKMDEGLDTGPVAMAEKVKITADMTAGELHDQLSVAGADLMVRAMAALERDSLTLTPQTEDGVTYASKITKAETRIDWTQPAIDVHNRIRGLAPFPGAWCEMEIGEDLERVKLLRSILATGVGDPGTVLDDDLRIACGEGAVRLRSLQRAGGKVMDGQEFQRGAKVAQGTRLP